MLLSDSKITLEQMLLAIIADDLQFLAWAKTKDAQTGTNRPKSILNRLLGHSDDSETHEVYESLEEFERARQKIINEGG